MKHAYLIIAHNEWPILRILLSMLDDSRNDIYIHVDKRSTSLYNKVKTHRTVYAKLICLNQRICVRWGNFSQVEVEYILFKEALAHGPYAYYHLLSGTDLPLKSQTYIHEFFTKHQGKEFISFLQGAEHHADLQRKVSLFYILNHQKKDKSHPMHSVLTLLRNSFIAIQKGLHLKRLSHVEFKKGWNWVSITHACCTYLVDMQYSYIVRRLHYTLCPDEIFLQTLIWNSEFRKHLYNTTDESEACQRKIDWNRGKPYTWEEKDLEELMRSHLLFARKFSSQHLNVALSIQAKTLIANGHER